MKEKVKAVADPRQSAQAGFEADEQEMVGGLRSLSPDSRFSQSDHGGGENPNANQGQSIQMAANDSPHVKQLKGFQSAAAQSPQVAQLKAIQSAANASRQVSQLRSFHAVANIPAIQRKAESSGSGLPGQLQAGIEQLSGVSMQGVNVHMNSDMPAQMQAHAYAQGSDIHIAPGQEQHLPHEAWHVAQQRQGRVQANTSVGGNPVNDSPSLEQEADTMGAKAMQMKMSNEPLQLKAAGAGENGIVQRVPADFVAHGTLNIAGSGNFRKNWEAIQTAVRAYSVLANDNLDGRQAQLRVIKTAMEKWRTDNNIYTTAFNALSQDRQTKVTALNNLDTDIQNEWVDILDQSGMDADTAGNLVVPHGQRAVNDPLLTRRVKGAESWGFFKAGAQLVKADNTNITPPTEGHSCRLLSDGTAPRGKFSGNYFKVKESKTSGTMGTKASIANGTLFKDDVWVLRTQVVEGNMTTAAVGLEYQDQSNAVAHPLFDHAPVKEDVQQNGLGDCWLMAALVAIVESTPQHFPDNMKDNFDGTVTVRLYDVNGLVFAPRFITVRKSVVKRTGTNNDGFGGGALWVSMMEKAYVAAGYSGNNSDRMNVHTGSYGMIEGGNPKFAMEHILGRASTKASIDAYAPAGRAAMKDWTRLVGAPNFPQIGGMRLIQIQNHVANELGDAWTEFLDTEQPRLEQFNALMAQVDDPAEEEVAASFNEIKTWLRTNVFPGKRGTGVYAPWQVELFRDIAAQVDAGHPTTLSTKEKVVTGGDDDGLAGENIGKGLAGPHAYAVLDFHPNPVPDAENMPANQLMWLKIRNPWGDVQARNPDAPDPGRTYHDKHTDEDLDQPYDQPRTHGENHEVNRIGAQGSANPEFWIELSDVGKRFEHFDHA